MDKALGNQQKSFYIALAYHESLLLFIVFLFEVYVIENNVLRRGFYFFFSSSNDLKTLSISHQPHCCVNLSPVHTSGHARRALAAV